MKLECIAKPEQEVLQLEDVKTYLRIDGDTEDAFLASLISAAREYCENYQHRAYGALTLRMIISAADAQADIELPRTKNLGEIQNIFVINSSGAKAVIENYSLSYGDINTHLRIEEALPIDAYLVIEYHVKGECDESTLLAMRLLVAHWYENRLAADSKSYNEPPFAVTALLNPGRVML